MQRVKTFFTTPPLLLKWGAAVVLMLALVVFAGLGIQSCNERRAGIRDNKQATQLDGEIRNNEDQSQQAQGERNTAKELGDQENETRQDLQRQIEQTQTERGERQRVSTEKRKRFDTLPDRAGPVLRDSVPTTDDLCAEQRRLGLQCY